MKKIVEEILTYEVYERDEFSYYISIPVNNLVNPKFMITDNNLVILLGCYTKAYIVKNIPEYIYKAIIDRQCYIKENINITPVVEHLISLTD